MIGKNNPLNIRYCSGNRWIGQSGQTKGFCNFDTLEHGVRAAAYLLMRSYRKRGLRTYAELIDAFAPPSENPTDNYVAFVCDKLHVFPWDIPSTVGNFAGLIRYMWIFENGSYNVYATRWIFDIINKYNLKVYEVK